MSKRKPVWTKETERWLRGGWALFDDLVSELRAAEDVVRAARFSSHNNVALRRALARFDRVTGKGSK